MKNGFILRQIPKNIWILGIVSMLMDISSEMIHSILPLFMVTTLGMSAFLVGLIEGLAEATALMVRVFSGALSDYIGKRKGLTLFGYALGAFSKPFFAMTTLGWVVLGARLMDRIGKGIRGAPRDALVADLSPPELRGASFGLRQSLDTLGAFLGPLIATGLMLLLSNDFRMVFWLAFIPALLSVFLLVIGLREPKRQKERIVKLSNPIRWENIKRMGGTYWWIVVIGAAFSLARFSEAFLVLRAQQSGIPLSLVPLVMGAMNLVYAVCAYPFGKLSDKMSHNRLLAFSLVMLLCADLLLSIDGHWGVMLAGVALWGVHMGMSQGLLATMIAATAPADMRGMSYGFFNLVSGVAMLFASVVAGGLWDGFGAAYTFYAGAGFCVLTIALVSWHASHPKIQVPILS
ncbi:MAG: MFS transporter [Desulfovibrio sp.]|jgi:MFS family permease|nr:MFS transporter [Desulfovibrio sp.]